MFYYGTNCFDHEMFRKGVEIMNNFPICDKCNSENVYRKTDASWCKKNEDWTEVQGVEFHCFECGNSKVDVGEEFY